MSVAFVVENKPGASSMPGTMDNREGAARRLHAGLRQHRLAGGQPHAAAKLPYDVEKDLTLVRMRARCSTCSR